MNKVLVTGLALGKETGVCDVCNFDFSWIINHPSVLIWADKILVTETIWDAVANEKHPFNHKEAAISLKLIFDIAKSASIIEVIKSSDLIKPDLTNDINNEVQKDRVRLAKFFPDHIILGDEEKVPGQLFVDGSEYCSVRMWTIYAAFVIARSLNAQCLFNSGDLNFCKYKFGITNFPNTADPGTIEVFRDVFQAYIPDYNIFPEYVYIKKDQCAKCTNIESCKDTYLAKVESNLKNILTWRNYDEIQQMKDVVDDIIRKQKEAGGVLNPSDVLHEFQKKQEVLRKRIKLVFPKIKRWTNITTMLSIPVVVAGIGVQNPLITVSGATLAGLSRFAKEIVDFLSNKYNWVGFITKNIELHR